jgi:hypothetical protein
MDRCQFATRSLAAAADAVLHRHDSYAAAPVSAEQVPRSGLGSVPFHAWTLLDNFQWAEGYTERYIRSHLSEVPATVTDVRHGCPSGGFLFQTLG